MITDTQCNYLCLSSKIDFLNGEYNALMTTPVIISVMSLQIVSFLATFGTDGLGRWLSRL